MNINELSTLSFLVPITLGTRNFLRLPIEGKILTIYLIVTLALDLLIWNLSSNSFNTMPFFHIHTLIEFVIIVTILYCISNSVDRKLIVTLTVLFMIFSCINLCFFEHLSQFNSNQRFVECLFLVILFVRYLFQNQDTSNSTNNRFLVVCFLVYFIGTILVFVLSKELFLGKRVNYLWVIHALLNIALNLLFVVFLFKSSKQNH